jgi:hydrogenase maturation protease
VTTDSSVPLVIGIGNTFRSDDGVGIWVARRLRHEISRGVSILEATGEGGALLEAWKGAASVFLLDAMRSGAAPGTIHRFDAAVEPIRAKFFRTSSHAFGVGEAVELARALNQLPPHLIIYGIEGANFGPGVELSAVVLRSAAEVCERLLSEACFSRTELGASKSVSEHRP